MKSNPKEFTKIITAASLIEDLIAVAKKLESDTLRVSDYIRYGKHDYCTLWKTFGGWRPALQAAGLKPITAPCKMITEEAMFKNLAGVWMKLGRQPAMREMKYPVSAYSYALYIHFFGSWMKALRKFVEYGNILSTGDELEKEIKPEEETAPPVERDKRTIPQAMRFSVLLRDGFRCTACGRSPLTHPGVILHCDHIIPWSRGGKTVIENLRTLCAECNIGKGDRLEEIQNANTMER